MAADKTVPSVDMVNHPKHYGGKGNPYEAIKVIDAWRLGFCLGNTVKYISRTERKWDQLEDLQKASWYVTHEIEKLIEARAAAEGTGKKPITLSVATTYEFLKKELSEQEPDSERYDTIRKSIDLIEDTYHTEQPTYVFTEQPPEDIGEIPGELLPAFSQGGVVGCSDVRYGILFLEWLSSMADSLATTDVKKCIRKATIFANELIDSDRQTELMKEME